MFKDRPQTKPRQNESQSSTCDDEKLESKKKETNLECPEKDRIRNSREAIVVIGVAAPLHLDRQERRWSDSDASGSRRQRKATLHLPPPRQ